MKTTTPEANHSSHAQQESAATTIGSYCMVIGKALDSCGVDSNRVLRAAGISAEFANDPMSRLPTTTLNKLYRACVEVTNNPYFGLTVAKFIHVSNLHALGHALAASATLMDFCRRLERYFRLVSEVAKISVDKVGDKVMLRFDFLVDVSGETEDAFFGFLVHTMRLLYKPGFNPVRVEFHRSMPLEGAEPYTALMNAPVTFSNDAGLFVFESTDMEKALDGSSPELAQVNDNIATNYLARLDKHDVITRVTQKIIELLPDGECSREKVAEALCMSSATMQRKLSLRGTKFQDLLDDTRKELACSYVQQSTRSMIEITFLLGFTDSSNFTRAFKRWTGTSPTAYKSAPRTPN